MAASMCAARTREGQPCARPLNAGRCPHHGTVGASSDPALLADANATAAAANTDPFAAEPVADSHETAQVARLIDRFDNGPQKVQVERDPDWYQPCTKCGGTGLYTSARTGGGGECSVCWGTGRTLTRDGKKQRAAARAAAVDGVREQIRAELRDAPDLADALDSVLTQLDTDDAKYVSGFAADVARKWVERGSLTDRQAAGLTSWHAEQKQREADRKAQEARRAAAPPAPEGRVDFAGTITSVKTHENAYGTVYKMRVDADEGWSAWMTVPRALVPSTGLSALKGASVNLTATLERSADDPKFAFGKRPRVTVPDGWEDTRLGPGDAIVYAGLGVSPAQYSDGIAAADAGHSEHIASYMVDRVVRGLELPDHNAGTPGRPATWEAVHAALSAHGDVPALQWPAGYDRAKVEAKYQRMDERAAQAAEEVAAR